MPWLEFPHAVDVVVVVSTLLLLAAAAAVSHDHVHLLHQDRQIVVVVVGPRFFVAIVSRVFPYSGVAPVTTTAVVAGYRHFHLLPMDQQIVDFVDPRFYVATVSRVFPYAIAWVTVVVRRRPPKNVAVWPSIDSDGVVKLWSLVPDHHSNDYSERYHCSPRPRPPSP